MSEVPPHPAKFSDPILEEIKAMAVGRGLYLTKDVLDPFAGVGRIYEVFPQAVGVDLQPKWAAADRRTRVGNSRYLTKLFRKKFGLVVTSPGYGNRMSDHHNNRDLCKSCCGTGLEGSYEKDGWIYYWPDAGPCKQCKGAKLSRRHTYTHYYGEPLEHDNSGAMQWGDEYRELHQAVWQQVWDVLMPGGHFILNVSDHQRQHKTIPVEQWHIDTLTEIGFVVVEERRVTTKRQKHGQNYDKREGTEGLYLLRKP